MEAEQRARSCRHRQRHAAVVDPELLARAAPAAAVWVEAAMAAGGRLCPVLGKFLAGGGLYAASDRDADRARDRRADADGACRFDRGVAAFICYACARPGRAGMAR